MAIVDLLIIFRSCTKPQAPKPQDHQIASAIRRGGLSTLLSPRLVQAEMAAVPGRQVSIVWGRMRFVPGQGVAHVRPRRSLDGAGINPSSRRSTAAVHTHSRPSIFFSSLGLSSGLALPPSLRRHFLPLPSSSPKNLQLRLHREPSSPKDPRRSGQ